MAILHKEWLELRQDRTLLSSTLLPPLLLTIMPIVIVYALGRTPDDDITQLGSVLVDPSLAGLDLTEMGQALMGKQFSLLLLLMPLFIPSIIASYSIVGEKTRRTLEPILATPISTGELLLAKSLAASLPALLITWLCAAIFMAGLALVALSPRVFAAVITPAWVLMLLLCAPLLTLISVAASVMISARVNDPRSAQQLSAVVIVPIMVLFFSQLFGLVVITLTFVVVLSLVLAIVAALALWVAVRIFQRESILTRWT